MSRVGHQNLLTRPPPPGVECWRLSELLSLKIIKTHVVTLLTMHRSALCLCCAASGWYWLRAEESEISATYWPCGSAITYPDPTVQFSRKSGKQNNWNREREKRWQIITKMHTTLVDDSILGNFQLGVFTVWASRGVCIRPRYIRHRKFNGRSGLWLTVFRRRTCRLCVRQILSENNF